MPKVIAEISMSLDGFIAGPNDRVGQGLGEGGERLHEWLTEQASWRERHGLEGGEAGADSEALEDTWSSTGATILGKRMFDLAEGWGDEPPFHMPVFVLTHDAREPLVKAGGTTFTFVSDGVERALEDARAAAGDKDVAVAGGASTIQQFIKAGLLDELQIHLVPVLLGAGRPLFDLSSGRQIELQPTKVINSPNVTHLRYRFVK
jgi:dihydrofolate reductase